MITTILALFFALPVVVRIIIVGVLVAIAAGIYWFISSDLEARNGWEVAQVKVDTLTAQLDREQRLTTWLYSSITQKDAQIAQQKQIIQSGNDEADRKQAQLEQLSSEKKQAIAGLSAAKLRIEALKTAYRNGDLTNAQLRDSISLVPVFTEEQANRAYVQAVYERDLWRDSTRSVFEQSGQLKQQVSNLKTANGILKDAALYAEEQLVDESQTKRFLGSGRKKAMNVRAKKVRQKRGDAELQLNEKLDIMKELNP